MHGEHVEELAADAEERHLAADVEVRAHKTYRVEDVTGGAATAASEQVQTEEKCMTRSWSCANSRMSSVRA